MQDFTHVNTSSYYRDIQLSCHIDLTQPTYSLIQKADIKIH